ncbi:MAG: hypothetical protein M5T52_15465 [Ignavibacteriaceae bacterium]|nr:hypothetical protein [Ignavibacteriaceae bacterium]
MNREIVESFADMVKMKGIDKDVLAGILEEVFTLLVRKKYGEEARCDVVVNMDRGDIEIYLERQIVDEVIDPGTQISIEDVNKKEMKMILMLVKITLKRLHLLLSEED